MCANVRSSLCYSDGTVDKIYSDCILTLRWIYSSWQPHTQVHTQIRTRARTHTTTHTRHHKKTTQNRQFIIFFNFLGLLVCMFACVCARARKCVCVCACAGWSCQLGFPLASPPRPTVNLIIFMAWYTLLVLTAQTKACVFLAWLQAPCLCSH